MQRQSERRKTGEPEGKGERERQRERKRGRERERENIMSNGEEIRHGESK